jgi:hypothetical protein
MLNAKINKLLFGKNEKFHLKILGDDNEKK